MAIIKDKRVKRPQSSLPELPTLGASEVGEDIFKNAQSAIFGPQQQTGIQKAGGQGPTQPLSFAQLATPRSGGQSGLLGGIVGSVENQKEEDVFVKNLLSQLDVLSGLEGQSQSELDAKKLSVEEQLQADLKKLSDTLNLAFAPQISAVKEAGEATGEAAAFTAAGAGSVRGSRQTEMQIDIERQTGEAVAAVEAEKAAQLMLGEAQLRGASDEVLESLNQRVIDLGDSRRQIEADLELAKAGILDEQVAAAQKLEEDQLAALQAQAEAQGLHYNPFTGETVSSLEGEKLKADIALQDAKTADIYNKLQQPNIDIQYFTDELGNVTAQAFNKDTGEFETVELGKLGASQKWAIGALNTGSTGGGGGGGGVVPPSVTSPQTDVEKVLSNVEAILTRSPGTGLPQIDLTLGK